MSQPYNRDLALFITNLRDHLEKWERRVAAEDGLSAEGTIYWLVDDLVDFCDDQLSGSLGLGVSQEDE